jgi:hypothetical protein
VSNLDLKLIHQEKIKPISTVTGTASDGALTTFSITMPEPIKPVPALPHREAVPAAHSGR